MSEQIVSETQSQISSCLQSLVSNISQEYQQKLHALEQQSQSTLQELQSELTELRSYKDVSLVNKLTVQVDQLQNENTLLRKRLSYAGGDSISTYTAPASLASERRSKPLVKKRPEAELQEPVQQETTELQEPEQPETTEPPVELQEPEQLETAEPPVELQEPEQPETTEPPVELQVPDNDELQLSAQQETTESPQAETTHELEPEEPEPELYLVDLNSGSYFWDPSTGNLHEKVSDTEAGDVQGRIKTVKIRNQYYYQDTNDNSVYHYVQETGDIGECCGSIVNKKFVRK